MLNDPQENFNVAGKPENAEVTMFLIVIKPTLDEPLPGDCKSELEAEIRLENSGLDNFIVGRAFTNQAKKTDMKQKLKLHHAFINWMCWPNKNLNPGALVNIKVKDDRHSQTRNIFFMFVVRFQPQRYESLEQAVVFKVNSRL